MSRPLFSGALAAFALALMLAVGPSACGVVAGLDGLRFADEDAGAPCGPDVPCDDQNPCTLDTCITETGKCSFMPLGEGAPNPGVPDLVGDCQSSVCVGGQGQMITDDQDLPNLPGDCQVGGCNQGKPTVEVAPTEQPCSTAGGQVCDGKGGCVACNTDAQCGLTDECRVSTCANGVCAQTFTANHTQVATQVPGDCQKNVCDGAGTVVSESDDTDVMGDGNPCTDDLCQGGVPQHPNSPVSTACGVGQVCNGMGACVGCVDDSQCNAPETCGGCGAAGVCCCTPETCASLGLQCGSAPDGCGGMLTCNDGKNNGETDVDCGGPSCSVKCAQGKGCAANTDCLGGFCSDGVCCNQACSGSCVSCIAARKGAGLDGVCGPILAGTDPDGECGMLKLCDGMGACQ